MRRKGGRKRKRGRRRRRREGLSFIFMPKNKTRYQVPGTRYQSNRKCIAHFDGHNGVSYSITILGSPIRLITKKKQKKRLLVQQHRLIAHIPL